ncbi:MAG: arginine--tRNA ligase domain-containing protein, partial [Candidatus Hodarchaeales archaeon]
ARKLGWIDHQVLVHTAHGLFKFEGKKMASRKGTDVDLYEVLQESVKKAREIINRSETGRGLGTAEKKKISEMVGIGAIKYYDLMHNPKSDIDFDWDKVFLMEGNSGPYIQYTFARTQSVLRKSRRVEELESGSNWKLKIENLEIEREELSVLRTIVHFPEVVQEAAERYSPNLICNYLYDLAQKFNTFYNAHRILERKSEALSTKYKTNSNIKNPNDKKVSKLDHSDSDIVSDFDIRDSGLEVQTFRLTLTKATGQILQNGLHLLGIKTPERM